jgi:hypothetical protein
VGGHLNRNFYELFVFKVFKMATPSLELKNYQNERRKLSCSLPVSRTASGENGQNNAGLCGCRA